MSGALALMAASTLELASAAAEVALAADEYAFSSTTSSASGIYIKEIDKLYIDQQK